MGEKGNGMIPRSIVTRLPRRIRQCLAGGEILYVCAAKASADLGDAVALWEVARKAYPHAPHPESHWLVTIPFHEAREVLQWWDLMDSGHSEEVVK